MFISAQTVTVDQLAIISELLDRFGWPAAIIFALWRRWLVLGWTYNIEVGRTERLERLVTRFAELTLKGTSLVEVFHETTTALTRDTGGTR